MTARDAWNYNSSALELKRNANRMVDFFNRQLELFQSKSENRAGSRKERIERAKRFVDRDPTNFSWDAADFTRLANGEVHEVDPEQLRIGTYRAFFRQHVNFKRQLNNSVYQLQKLFPSGNSANLAICLPAPGPGRTPFTPLMVDGVTDLCPLGSDASLLFPKWIYDTSQEDPSRGTLFDSSSETGKRYNVSDRALIEWQQALGAEVTKESIFYYVYGVLHSPMYQDAFRADVKKQHARVPVVTKTSDFLSFSRAGERLSELHTGYEAVETWPELEIRYTAGWDPNALGAYRVEKMRYAKNGKETDLTTIIFNAKITIADIPEQAHDYRVGSRSAIDWIIDRYQIKTHKDSGIVNDPNDWADEHDDPTYIFDLLRRIVTVSMRTNEIVAGLPKLKF